MKPENNDPFILTRRRRTYSQSGPTPKISIDAATYKRLQKAAIETGMSISSLAKQAINYAFDRLKYANE